MSSDKYVWYWHEPRGEVCVTIFLNGRYHATKIVHTGVYTKNQFESLPELHKELCRKSM